MTRSESNISHHGGGLLQGYLFSPHYGGKQLFLFSPQGPENGGEITFFPPGPKYGGEKPPKFFGACGGLVKKPGFAGFCSCFF